MNQRQRSNKEIMLLILFIAVGGWGVLNFSTLVGFVTACRLAVAPTILSPVFEKATTEGVVLAPSAFAITTGSPPSITATHEFVVPKSIPIIFAIIITSKI